MCEKQILFTDALLLNISNNSLFTAIGSQAFFLINSSVIRVTNKMHYKKIHGSVCNPKCELTGLLLLYAENEFSLYKYDLSQKDIFILIYEGETKDWINAAIFLKNEEGCQFALHMAHSSLLRLQYDNTSNLQFGECSILELARCTDYSMLYSTSLYGNSYTKLIIISGNGFGEILIWQPHSPLNFNISTRSFIYPLLMRLKAHNGVVFSIDFNLAAQLLVTTSDDRSLKFWKLVTNPGIKFDASSIKPSFSCFGHTARVICAIIAEYGQVFVISGGEDSNICVWSQTGEMLLKRRQQFGAPVWRLAFDNVSASLYSTGSTGNIYAYNLKSILSPNQAHSEQLMHMGLSNEYLVKIKYLTNSTIIALSNKNHLFYMRLMNLQKSQIWEPVSIFPSYKCTVLAVCDGLIATCGYKRITLLNYNVDTGYIELIYDGIKFEGLIQSFHFLSKDLYLISDEYGNCHLLKGNNMEVDSSINISTCRKSWITSAILVNSNCLLMSCRNGKVMIVTRESSPQLQIKHVLKDLHGNMGSIVLKLLRIDDKFAYIISAAHESTLKVICLSLTEYRLTILQRQTVPLTWIEAIPTLDVLIGFNDNHLVVWSHENGVILQFQCGGGHRCWDYKLNNEVLDIIYMKQKHVFHHREQLYNKWSGAFCQILRNKWHIRSCNIIQIVEQENYSQTYIVSAGDDNIIKISRITGQSFHLCAELHTHISSVRHLVICPVNSENDGIYWLIFSVGGRAQLCINKFDPNGAVLSELCSHTVRLNSDGNNASLDARLMTISVLQNSKWGKFSLYVASSDGKIRLLQWELENPLQLFLDYVIDIKRCPIQMQTLNNHNLLLITTTNGMLYGFDRRLRLKRFEQQLHVASINAFETLYDGSHLHILTGGDDEAIKHTIIETTNLSILKSAEISPIHNAQITAMSLHSLQDACQKTELYAYTCSMDKQIYKLNLNTLQHTRIGFTCLSDIKGILNTNQCLFIYGCGLEVISLEKN
ncbi:WD repeat-containing protein 6 isoform X2 [Drosophila mojavensis]|uniref:tRNA (34-2'-O)-methyltransferase regulator WDR6 n=1 Tax=Drosophila mojavensis TaxID=7230 RepID=A0A0Q9XH34_DROMO|nr:WD repeat-containing protein 6 isoform X2 [Drosophila mojavensis]KRG07771.1 uncharacterized protein Dmoj_GI14207, isoform B [Drosophila mojavensis]